MTNTLHTTQNIDTQWENIPDELKDLYVRSTEPLYTQAMPVETIAQKEAKIYNSIFGQFGLSKPVQN